ncbi:MAG: hypothetical protein CVV64_03235 [Candidatus Wallbacteria bacterium HGW-Wallbacteria-1]|jgi:parvulin-like peptidyl-prolyl isomerase|uniref:PpiC domain-containing protein n=1 Tax=Candidatus Wallbacteria bacterium HGW-Wallbacteria-1 TaxID=2013854 RepID=A0A2N1PTP9_9BACT|nr:MAG: hypothetical protein CVV64_03235 [Candidatus Wallbacteria bacterium HGW-Wallbacteria-1]
MRRFDIGELRSFSFLRVLLLVCFCLTTGCDVKVNGGARGQSPENVLENDRLASGVATAAKDADGAQAGKAVTGRTADAELIAELVVKKLGDDRKFINRVAEKVLSTAGSAVDNRPADVGKESAAADLQPGRDTLVSPLGSSVEGRPSSEREPSGASSDTVRRADISEPIGKNSLKADPRTLVAQAGGKEYTAGAVLSWALALAAPDRIALRSREAMEKFVRNHVLGELLVRRAEEKGYSRHPRIRAAEEHFTRNYLIETLLQKRLKSPEAVPEESVKKYYNEHPELYNRPAETEAWMIIVDSMKLATEIEGKIRAGEDFRQLARRYSLDVSASEGGYVGRVRKDSIPASVWEVLDSLSTGQIGGPVKSPFGHHLILKGRTQSAVIIPFDAARKSIVMLLAKSAAPALRTSLYNEAVKSCGATLEVTLLDNLTSPDHSLSPELEKSTLFNTLQKPCTLGAFASELRIRRDSGAVAPGADGVRSFAREYMQAELLASLARSEGIELPAETMTAYRKNQDSFRVAIMIDEAVRKDLTITSDAPELYYREMRETFRVPEAIKLEAAAFSTDTLAIQAIEKLKSGKTFDTVLASADGDESLSNQAGQMGWVTRESMPTQIFSKLFAQQGKFTEEPLKLGNIYYVFQVQEKRASYIPEFRDIRETVENSLKAEVFEKRREMFLGEVWKEYQGRIEPLGIEASVQLLHERSVGAVDGLEPSEDLSGEDAPITGDLTRALDSDVLVRWQDNVFTVGDFKKQFSRLRESFKQRYRNKSGVLKLFTAWLDRILLSREAERIKVNQDAGVMTAIERDRTLLAIETYVEREIYPKLTIPADAVQKEYESRSSDFEYLVARMIRVKDRETLREALSEIGNGMPFAKAAAKFSQDSSAQRDGLLPAFHRNMLPNPAIGDLFRLDVGALSEPVEINNGWAVFKVEEKGLDALEQVRDSIEQTLLGKAREKALTDHMSMLRDKWSARLNLGPAQTDALADPNNPLLSEVVIDLGFRRIKMQEVVERANQYPLEQASQLMANQSSREAFIKQLANTELLYRAALDAGIDQDPGFVEKFSFEREARLIDGLFAREKATINPDRTQLVSFYENNRGLFRSADGQTQTFEAVEEKVRSLFVETEYRKIMETRAVELRKTVKIQYDQQVLDKMDFSVFSGDGTSDSGNQNSDENILKKQDGK